MSTNILNWYPTPNTQIQIIDMSSIDLQRVFYEGEWTAPVESLFVDGLLREAIAGNYREGHLNNGAAIRKVMKEINETFNATFDYKYCYDKIRRLRLRYEAFTRILATEGVCYSKVDNKVDCDPNIWDEICKTERLRLVYRVFGERYYEALQKIFEAKDDSVGYNQLLLITELSSSLNSLSIIPSQVPRIQETVFSSFWNEYLGASSEKSDVGTGPSK